MASLTVRDIPEDAKHRFRQIAAAHGRSMEEHLRQLVISASAEVHSKAAVVAEERTSFRHAPSPRFERTYDAQRAARIRAMSSAEFVKHLVDTAGGVGLELPPRSNLPEDREIFGAD